MEFLSIVIVLGLLQLWGSGGPIQRDNWFNGWINLLKGMIGPGRVRLVVLVAVPVVAALFLQAFFDSMLFGLLSLLLFVVVLLFSLGRGDFSEAVHRYLYAWNSGDFESAYDKALSIGDFQQSSNIGDHVSLHEHVRRAVMYEGYQRWFAVVFWFLLLGPCGALGYRLSYLCGRTHLLDSAERQHALAFVHNLDWIPARLLAISFSLTGNFVNCFNRCWQQLTDNMPIPELLENSARSAISSEGPELADDTDQARQIERGREELTGLQGLISRSVIAWLVILAIWTVASA